MAIFTKESLETLRQRVDLVDLLSSHIELKRTGAAYKGLCPFHDEKTPSFTIQKGDTHYHCFGCGAHGDAIQFLMTHQRLNFVDAVESLAERFQVSLEKIESKEEWKGPSKTSMKEALDHASRFYQFVLLHTPEGHQALEYLYKRGIDLEFIQRFQIGLAPSQSGMLRKILHSKSVTDTVMEHAGLLKQREGGDFRDFFIDRITFPIRDPSGAVIGFSARKYKEETFGGKYVNTTETGLFKKSRVLFGLNYCRRRIAKERRAIIVEGQIDALRLIHTGFDITVAGQGTAFGEGHVRELTNLGVHQVFLALDPDTAGQEATRKIGHLFQQVGVEVRVVALPAGSDPDAFLRERGPEAFQALLDTAEDYITFLVRYMSQTINVSSPAGKNELVTELVKVIRSWGQPVMVHESLRKLAQLTQTPEEMVGVGQEQLPNIYIKKNATIGLQTVDADRIVESDLLRWLLITGNALPQLPTSAQTNLRPEDFHVPICRKFYETYMQHHANQLPTDLLSLVAEMHEEEGQTLMQELLQKKVNREKAEVHFKEALQRLLDRNWMEQREELRLKIQSERSDAEASELMKRFDELKRNPPTIK